MGLAAGAGGSATPGVLPPWSTDGSKTKCSERVTAAPGASDKTMGRGRAQMRAGAGTALPAPGLPRRAARPGPAGLPTSVPGAQPPPSFGVAATEARRPGTMCQTGKQEKCSSRKPQFWKIKTKIFFSKIIIEKNTLQ